MNYADYGIPWNECRTRLQTHDMQRLEWFATLNQRCGGNRKNFWCVKEEGAIADVYIFDFIGDSDQLCEKLCGTKAPCINLWLNSTGGNALEMLKILGALSGMVEDKAICTVVSGLAASASSVLAVAGERVCITDDAFFAIHSAYPEKNKQIKVPEQEQDAFNLYIAQIFNTKTGIPINQLRSWMKQDTLFTPQEALELGFVDEIIPPTPFFQEEGFKGLLQKCKGLV